MRCVENRTIECRGTTIVELTVAVAIVAVVFAAIMPLFAGVRNSADARWANLEMVQNARVLNEQLCRHLAAAKRVTAVSSDASADGYIQFEAADGAFYRCALDENGYVVFGLVGEPSELVGPVSSLRFTCYDGNDLTAPTTTPEEVRFVTWEARLQSEGTLTHDKTASGACYLRVRASDSTAEEETVVTYDLATRTPGQDCFAFADQGKPQVPDGSATPAQLVESEQYAAIGAADGKYHVLEVSSDAQYAQVRLVFLIDQDPAAVVGIAATWIGAGVNVHSSCIDGAALYLWNYESSAYDLVQTSADTEGEVTLAGSGAGSASQYLGGSTGKTVTLLIVSNDKKRGQKANTLSTDYAKIDITVSGGADAFTP